MLYPVNVAIPKAKRLQSNMVYHPKTGREYFCNTNIHLDFKQLASNFWFENKLTLFFKKNNMLLLVTQYC